jgi:hypothetical protein
VDYVYGCGPWCRWLIASVGNKSGSVCTHERLSSLPSCQLATAQRECRGVEGSRCLVDPCSSRSHTARNVRPAPGALGVQGTRSERRDRAALWSVWSQGRVGLQRGGGGELVGEVGRPGVLSMPLANLGAHR